MWCGGRGGCPAPPLHLMISRGVLFLRLVAQEAVRRVLQGVGDRLEDLEEGSDFQVEQTFFFGLFSFFSCGSDLLSPSFAAGQRLEGLDEGSN